ncbi:MAG: adenosine deaminase, partial [Patescibacteria group bacterium]|nr:adenosine deaminase [Patescibacteria group bacterium]
MVRDFQVKSLPKVDLHRHFEGALRVETLFEFYKKRHPKDRLSLRKFSQRLKADKRKKSLVEFISKLGTKYIRSLKLSKKEIERLAFEVVVDAVEDKVIYLELRVCPLAHERKDLSVDEFFKALVRGVKRASKKFKIKVRLIVSFKREDGVKKNLELVELLKRNMKVIVGVDLCGDEAKYLNEDYKKIFKLTRSLGFKTTIHAGEAAGWQSIESAVKVLKADRIGHGVNIFPEADRLVKLLKARGVGVEMCLQSNVLTGAVSNLKKHPINYWYDQGVLVSVNTDNPVTTDYSLSQEWRKLIKERGFTQGDFLIMQIQAIEMSFLDEKGK